MPNGFSPLSRAPMPMAVTRRRDEQQMNCGGFAGVSDMLRAISRLFEVTARGFARGDVAKPIHDDLVLEVVCAPI